MSNRSSCAAPAIVETQSGNQQDRQTEDDDEKETKAGGHVCPPRREVAGGEPYRLARKQTHASAEVCVTTVYQPHQRRIAYPPEASHHRAQEHDPGDGEPLLAEHTSGQVIFRATHRRTAFVSARLGWCW